MKKTICRGIVADYGREECRKRRKREREERALGPSGFVTAGGLTYVVTHPSKNQHRRRQITTHIIRSCRLPSHHDSFVSPSVSHGAVTLVPGPKTAANKISAHSRPDPARVQRQSRERSLMGIKMITRSEKRPSPRPGYKS